MFCWYLHIFCFYFVSPFQYYLLTLQCNYREKAKVMGRSRITPKAKEPIRLRMKDLSNGNKSLYLDIYRDGKRSYEYLKMYIIPEKDENAKRQNKATLAAANAIKSKLKSIPSAAEADATQQYRYLHISVKLFSSCVISFFAISLKRIIAPIVGRQG